MNFFKRLQNIYKLGELEPMKVGEQLQIGDTYTALKKPNMAQIISMRNPIKEIINEEQHG